MSNIDRVMAPRELCRISGAGAAGTRGIVASSADNQTGDQSEKLAAIGANFTKHFEIMGPRIMIYLKLVPGTGALTVNTALVLFGSDGAEMSDAYKNINASQQFGAGPTFTGFTNPMSWMRGTSYTAMYSGSLAAGSMVGWSTGIITAAGNYAVPVDLSTTNLAATAAGFGGGSAIGAKYGRLLVTLAGAFSATGVVNYDLGFAY